MGWARYECQVMSAEFVEVKAEGLLDRQRALTEEGTSILLSFFDRSFHFSASFPSFDRFSTIMLLLPFG
jgi:hypothetical protein